jgi:ornithine decarboxylase antizyme 1
LLSDQLNDKNNNFSTEFDKYFNDQDASIIYFKSSLSDEKEILWKTLLINGNLYVDIPSNILPDGSRDSFVSLLEFAEDQLDCSRVFVCMKKDRTDRSSLMRVFMFLGFKVVNPSNRLVPQNEEILSMMYTIE